MDLLAAVLVDPDLHTDRIMRLHREARTIFRAAHEDLCREAERERLSTRTPLVSR